VFNAAYEGAGSMTDATRTLSKAEARRVLQRAGVADELSEQLLAELPDPIDLDRAQPHFTRYGLTRERLMEHLGASQ
jgi:hypothetical protein